MTKVIYFFIFLNVSYWGVQEPPSNMFSIDSLEKEYELINSNFSKSPLKKDKTSIYRLLKKLIKTRQSYKEPTTQAYKRLDTLHAKTIPKLMDGVLFQTGKLDSLVYYKNYLKKNTTIPYYRAYSEDLAANVKSSIEVCQGGIENDDTAIENYRKSKHPENQIKIYNLTLFLTLFYSIHSNGY
jgi:hypothetical protein